jgi:hypothetical protein
MWLWPVVSSPSPFSHVGFVFVFSGAEGNFLPGWVSGFGLGRTFGLV